MSDEELLLLADQKEALKDVARGELVAELRKRRLNFVAPTIAEAILETAIASAEKIEQEFWARAGKDGKFKDEHFQEIVTEFAYVFLHLCARDAFNAISDPRKRGAFLDSVFYYILRFGKTECMTERHAVPAFTRREERPDPGILVVREGMDDLNERQKEYSLPLFAARDAPLAGTVFWEFGKHIVKICDHYDRQLSLQVEASLLASEAYRALGPVFFKMYEPPRKSVGFFRRLFKY